MTGPVASSFTLVPIASSLFTPIAIMAVTAFPSVGESPDLTLLNVARLFTRLEHNLLSPGSELRILRGSEFQRMRVTKVRPLSIRCTESDRDNV